MKQPCDSNSPKSHLEEQAMLLIKEYNDKWITPRLIWCSSQVGIDGNETADKLAEQGSKFEQIAEHHDTEKKAINKHVKEEAPKRRGMDDNLRRKKQVDISRLPSSYHPGLRHWRLKTGKCETEQSRACKEGPEMSEHILLNCPVVDDMRQ